jgi:ABC-2 type transport system permease protein
MFAILKKEFNSFFASPIAYLVIGVFLLLNGLFLWVFKDDFNILNAGFADLNAFFFLAPWIFLFLIPAITMKSFVDEYNKGTIELLKTKPISDWQIVLEKFAAALLLALTALVPTLTYVFTLSKLGNPAGNLDFGSILGSYIGLFFLMSTYTAIGVFTSILSRNQIVAFIIAVFFSFTLYYGFDTAANSFDQNTLLQQVGIQAHYKSISLGVIDTRDLLYFASVTTFFLFLTKNRLEKNKNSKQTALLIVSIIILNVIGHAVYKRFDFTSDQRYTLSKTTKALVSQIDETLLIQVYLKGDFPSEFKRLQVETKQYLDQLASLNKKIIIKFKNPNNQREALIKKGMFPSQLTIEEDGKMSEAIIFPWAEISFSNKTALVSLLPSSIVASQEEQLQKAIGNLEYEFSNAIQTVTQKNLKKIAILSGNGELTDIYQYSFLSALKKKYSMAKFSLDANTLKASKTLENLSNFDLAIVAKPTEKFTEKEKFVLDQFITNGGKTLWMLDNVQADQDSLGNTGSMLAYPKDLGLTNLLFTYGIRINNSIVKDLYAAKIPVATGNIGKQPQFKNLDWFYHPLAKGNPENPVTKNILPVRLQFANQIDTLKNNITKKALLVSSPLTRKVGTPKIIAIQTIAEEVVKSDYNGGSQLFAVLLSGNFNSAYKNRVQPFKTPLFKAQSEFNKMIVISDGDVGKNQILKGQPYDLSRDKWTNQQFGNKDFLLNAVDYLLDDIGLLNLRNKSLQIRMLDKQKAYKERFFWQCLNVVFPLLLLVTFGALFKYFRKRKYGF